MAQAAERRLGLVIGEAAYSAAALQTPADDAGVIAQALAADGFEVAAYADLDLPGTRKALSDFLGKAREAGSDAVVWVYLAGYGVQFDGDNFLVPVDARIARDVDVSAQAVRLSDFAHDLAALPLKARVLVYDLARAHPFARSGTPLASGLAIAGPRPGTVVAFNTAPGLVAPSDQGDYGLYAQALSEMLQTKGQGIDTLFSRLRVRVDALTNGSAVPWTEGTLDTPLVLLPPATDAPSLLNPFRALLPGSAADAYWTAIQAATLSSYGTFLKAYPRDPCAAQVAVLLAAQREAATWAQTRRANVAAAYWTYMRRYPRGPHFADARRGLAALPAALEPPPRFDLYVYSDLPSPGPEDLALINRPFVMLDTEASLPPPTATFVPERQAAFYDRLPPLLAVTAGTLPLPVPFGAASSAGRIVQPDFSGSAGPIIATEGLDKAGDPMVRQTGPDGRMLSSAIKSQSPNGGITVTQSDPDNRPVLTMVATNNPNGGRTVTQMGLNKQLIATMTTLVAANGNKVTTLSGPDGLPRSSVTRTPAGTIVPSRDAKFGVAAPVGWTRPVVLPALQRAAAPPPLLATGPIPAVAPAPSPLVPNVVPAPSAQGLRTDPAGDAPQRQVPRIDAPNAAASSPSPLPPLGPTIVPQPIAPAVTSTAPVAMPTVVAPAPAQPPLAPLPALPSAATALPAASAPGAVAEPVPPRKGPEPATAKTQRSAEADAHKAVAAPAQPTPPQRPKTAPAKAKPLKAAESKPRVSAKPPKKTPGARKASGRHRG